LSVNTPKCTGGLYALSSTSEAIVDVVGVVVVTVVVVTIVDQFNSTRASPIEAVVVDLASDVVEHPFQCHHVLRCGPLHGTVEVPHGEAQI
jgi:hypothetical protein